MVLKWAFRLLLLAVLLAGSGWLAFRLLGAPTVVATHPIRGPAVQAVYATGTVEASVTVRIAPRVAGRLVELRADEGQVVKADEVLARLENSDLHSTVTELEARARYAEQQYERNDLLFKQGYASRDQVDQARADFGAANASVKRAVEQLGFMTLKAPSNGRIIRRDGEVGDYIPVNQPVFFISDTGTPPRIEAEVDEEDVPSVHADQKVLIRADAYPDRVFDGTVAQITPKGDPVARSYRVRILLPADTPLMVGMTVETNIIVLERQNALLVPSTALSGAALWLVQDGKLVRQPVTVGAKGPERSEILKGLDETAMVVVQPLDSFKIGQRVKVKPVAVPTLSATEKPAAGR